MLEAPEEESSLGMEVYYSSARGIGGKLKKEPEDFIVDEVSTYPPRSETGDFAIARLRARNWENNRLVRQLAKSLRISRRRISFAGTKDKRAVTTQLFSIHAPHERVRELRIPDVDVLEVYPSDRGIELGELLGNTFEISIRDIALPRGDTEQLAERFRAEFMSLGGFPNFFGVQRFGAVRPNTHLIGKAIVHGDFEKAVMLYAASPEEGEEPGAIEARTALEETHDFALALKLYPKNLTFEKAIVNHLAARPEDLVGALRALPKNLLMLFVHAYQSYLFNRILSMRIRKGLPLNAPVEGDIALPPDGHGLPDSGMHIPVTAQNISKISEKASAGKAFISGVVFGSESGFASGEPGEIERAVIAKEGLSGKEFVIPQIREISSKGTRREFLAPLRSLEYSFIDDSTIKMNFPLNRGCYATALLRELMKGGLTDY